MLVGLNPLGVLSTFGYVQLQVQFGMAFEDSLVNFASWVTCLVWILEFSIWFDIET